MYFIGSSLPIWVDWADCGLGDWVCCRGQWETRSAFLMVQVIVALTVPVSPSDVVRPFPPIVTSRGAQFDGSLERDLP